MLMGQGVKWKEKNANEGKEGHSFKLTSSLSFRNWRIQTKRQQDTSKNNFSKGPYGRAFS